MMYCKSLSILVFIVSVGEAASSTNRLSEFAGPTFLIRDVSIPEHSFTSGAVEEMARDFVESSSDKRFGRLRIFGGAPTAGVDSRIIGATTNGASLLTASVRAG